MNTEPIIRLQDVSKSYGKAQTHVNVLTNVTLEFPRGDFVAVMGPSGSGKSTLLHLLGGLDRADSGEIECAAHRLDTLSEGQLTRWRSSKIGFIFQFYNLMTGLTAAENIELPLLLTKLNAGDRAKRVTTALEMVELANRAKHKPWQMSGGQQQRVAIARAIVTDPEILLCDEPTGDLDRVATENVLTLLKLLNDALGKTIVMVTHDPAAAQYAKRTLRLDKGQFLSAPETLA
jgi:putative ABC transport system ATP-binding protein